MCLIEVREGVASEGGLGDNAGDGEHGKAAVLELADLVLLQISRLGSKLERVEREVTWGTVSLAKVGNGRDGDDFKEGGPEQDLNHGARLDEHIVSGKGADLVNVSREVHEVGNDVAKGGKHSNTAMLELGFSEERNPLRALLGELKRIEGLQLRTFRSNKSTGEGVNSNRGSGIDSYYYS